MKTNELTGTALDWAVAQCMTGGDLFQSGRTAHAVVLHSVGGTVAPYFVKDSGVVRCVFEPSTNWAQGGPIIEREGFCIQPFRGGWECFVAHRLFEDDHHHSKGPTPLIAAMRCYVASKLGDTVDVPKELL